MAKKKVIEPIVGTGKNIESLTVQKSKPLFGLWKSELSLSSFKILDAYLARINSENPDRRTVVLQKGEIEKLLGVTKINKPDLDNRLKNLFQSVDLSKGTAKKAHRVALFEEVMAEQDDDGIWQITLTCTTAAKKYFFNIKDIGYLRYRLRSVVNITSRYSYILFTYLESNRFRKIWEVELDELKTILNCTTEQTYEQFKRFNDLILKKCHKELTEKTELRYSYEPVKKGRKVVAIRFALETIKDIPLQDSDQLPGQMELEDYLDDPREKQYSSEAVGFIASACEFAFSDAEMQVLYEISSCKFPSDTGGREHYDYMFLKWKEFKVREAKALAEQKPIKHRYSYFKTMLEKDI